MNKQPVSPPLSRRSFVRAAAVTSAVAGFPAITHSKSPNGKLAIGLIGVGGRGRGHVAGCRNEQVVSLCDVNKKNLDGAARFPWCKDARTTSDFRDFYEKIDDLDAVVVSTTEHTHAFATLPALEAKSMFIVRNPSPAMFMSVELSPKLQPNQVCRLRWAHRFMPGRISVGWWN